MPFRRSRLRIGTDNIEAETTREETRFENGCAPPADDTENFTGTLASTDRPAGYHGIFLFAVEGALAAIRSDLDLLGVMVLSFVTAFGGGVIRDLIVGATPPSAFIDRRYSLTAFAAALVTFVLFEHVARIPATFIQTLDAAGLAVFAVAGSEKALAFEIDAFVAILLGGITGFGGGTLRDVLLARVQVVLHADIYATAALLGAAIVAAAARFEFRLRRQRSPAGSRVSCSAWSAYNFTGVYRKYRHSNVAFLAV